MFTILTKTSEHGVKILKDKLVTSTISCNVVREKFTKQIPKLRNPVWFTSKQRKTKDDPLTAENKEFIKEVVQDRFLINNNNNQLVSKDLLNSVEWYPNVQRTGVIARKIGIYPLWLKNGKKIATTLLQVLDNHVIKYYPPEEFNPPRKHIGKIHNKKGCLLIGAEAADPSKFTKEYCGLFKDSGVIPKKTLGRFLISSDAALPPGTCLNAMHFPVGSFVDVRGLTKARGFQGVMKRHGFSGMPASHGVTKTHRRPGNIGGGGEKGRVWPGTKMPGFMGNRFRTLKGLKVWRINTKYNVLYVSGQNIPGETNSICYIYDSKLWTKRPKQPVPFPTYLQTNEELPEDIYDNDVHQFSEPTIVFDE